MKGKVKFFNKNKGFGFIQDENEQDYFFHFTKVLDEVELYENDNVEFEAEETPKGLNAINVKLTKGE